jgi:midasin (ATPase involved in ribosome maturation)
MDLDENFSHLALTKTIARKICLLYIKIISKIPTLIMGETGVGKTILISYLSRLIDGEIFTLNVHAGQSQNDIITWIEIINNEYEKS